ncbi:MAG: RNA methyltransferase [Candidatus Baltobacteraceae bacterium]|jgi:TrmH family RNA methyltransferase
MPIPLGAHSPKLEAVRALRTKAGRRREERYAVEGPTMLGEALRSGLQPEAVYATEAGYAALGALPGRLKGPVFLVPERAMGRLSELETPPGVLAVLPVALRPLAELLASGEPLVLLAGVADPGNAGTLLRAAEIFGLTRAVFGCDGVEPHNPKVVRASMGALFRTQLSTARPAELVDAAAQAGYSVVATARSGTPLASFRFSRRTILAIGNERRGVAGWLPRWDAAVAIEQPGEGESLNAAVAGGIVFYAFSQQFPNRGAD